jgi:predicted RNA-binding protein (virulence factor B family)
VTGVVYETSGNFGLFVAVDSMYSALVPKREVMRPVRIGEVISARVTRVKPDGKLDLSLREKGTLQMDRDMETVLRALQKGNGELALSDSSDPEKIRQELGMSKGAFKRAAGHLYKEGKIRIEKEKIVLL